MEAFDWQRMLLDDFPLAFLGEVALRATCAYLAVFIFLKVSGRRGVRQLSLFELVVILTLGSAAGDVSFYDDVPLLPVFVVFATLLLLYSLTTRLMKRSPRFGSWVEGKPVVIIRDGLYELGSLEAQNISSDEFHMELRRGGVQHLGQVRLGILEVDGDLSLYYFPAEQTRSGLSVLPEELNPTYRHVPSEGLYACNRCGNPQPLQAGQAATCPRCGGELWNQALDWKREP
ncbi:MULTISPECIES: YetF domain-containing protein [unclassified Pseudomonas]|uniref:YetF domain-containing protein n=1 Tax=unclassified Pseudomonas TaxID=196821 RepID=UPI00244C4CF1|nr:MULTISPECIES: YetF domain-containing protein [unclassified Pseudomonas]MDG9924693.1 DUF421 domain-containing protein [Pseudomonas sp. GD04045]MDH0036674.1 DUF421 domain-containing protein [Pseudomonas sp. GD04019]